MPLNQGAVHADQEQQQVNLARYAQRSRIGTLAAIRLLQSQLVLRQARDPEAALASANSALTCSKHAQGSRSTAATLARLQSLTVYVWQTSCQSGSALRPGAPLDLDTQLQHSREGPKGAQSPTLQDTGLRDGGSNATASPLGTHIYAVYVLGVTLCSWQLQLCLQCSGLRIVTRLCCKPSRIPGSSNNTSMCGSNTSMGANCISVQPLAMQPWLLLADACLSAGSVAAEAWGDLSDPVQSKKLERALAICRKRLVAWRGPHDESIVRADMLQTYVLMLQVR